METARVDGLGDLGDDTGDVAGRGATGTGGDIADGIAEDDRCNTVEDDRGTATEARRDGEYSYQTSTIREVRVSREKRAGEPSMITVVLDGGGVILLHPGYVAQFSLGDHLKPGVTLEIKRSLWPNGGIENIRAVA